MGNRKKCTKRVLYEVGSASAIVGKKGVRNW